MKSLVPMELITKTKDYILNVNKICSKAIDLPCNTQTFVSNQKTIIKLKRFQVLYKLSLLRLYSKSVIFHSYNGGCIKLGDI